MPRNISQTRARSLVYQVKAFLRLETLLTLLLRVAIVTALVSIISYRLAPHDNPRLGWVQPDLFHGFADVLLICWLCLSVALFIPFAPLIDLALCAAIITKLRGWINFKWLIHWTAEERSMTYLKDLDNVVELIAVAAITFLRILGLTLAVIEAYCSEEILEEYSFGRTLFGYIVHYEYDWWTLRRLPKEFIIQKWYQRTYRPWLQSVPQSPAPLRSQLGESGVVPLVHILLGSRTFLHRRGEGFWFVIVRGAVAIACLGALVASTANALFLQLNDESRAPPIETRHIPALQIGGKLSAPIWGVVIGINSRYVRLPVGTNLGNFVSVTEEVQLMPIKTVPRSSIGYSSSDNTLKYFYLVSYQCATLWQVGPLAYTPQIRIQVDYAALNMKMSTFAPERGIKIWPSLTSSITDVLASTKPTSLVMGQTLIASVEETLRSRSTSPIRATVGVDSSHGMHGIAQVSVLGADPLAVPSLNQTRTFASMRLFKEVRTTGWELHIDSRKHTVLSGLSTLGGLAAFLNSAFVVFFGGSLILVLFNIKPLSIFGLFHLFSKTTLSDRFGESFPCLHVEGSQPGHSDSGVVSFMRKYMVDLSPIPPARNPSNCKPDDSMITVCPSPRGLTKD